PVMEEPEETPEPAATHAPDLVKTTKFHHVGGDALPEMEELYNENRDLVEWLNIPDILDLPVVYKDNDYYLKRDFYKQKNTAGTIFLDENHPFKEKAQNLLLHGHNMKDGTMFGRLTQYIYDKTYIKNHPFINLSTLWRKEQYVIFAILDVSLNPKDETFFNYFTHNTFSSDAEFTSYIRQLQLRSMVAIPIDVDPSDALLTLSTCLEDHRLVIVARRLRNGETRAELRQRIHTSTRQ
ncbi:MAG: class B sortase, partial [Kiritimatiellae bacterium]|nr:class B sortase [Kiritimatiellia bacterium]